MKGITYAARTDAPTEREHRNREIAYQAALEGVVLLKNDSALPCPAGKIALYGAGISHTVKGGTGSGEVNERHSISILEGMENAGYEIVTRKWIEDYVAEYDRSYDAWVKKHRGLFSAISGMSVPFMFPIGREVTDDDISGETDTAIYVVSRQAGEGSDKKLANGDFDLTETEAASIRRIASSYKKSVLVINSGSYMSLSKIEDAGVSAIIFLCQLGMEGGRAFADIISGTVNPSGKLTDTWAKKYEDIACGGEYSYLSGDTSKEEYKEGIYVGYRYFDTFKVNPRYHFGYGLSYTDFAINTLAAQIFGSRICLTVSVENTGGVSGKEVVQVYVSAPTGKLPKEYQRLVAFMKTKLLTPGEKQLLAISFDISCMSSYCEECASYILDGGRYIVRVGSSSDDTVAAAAIDLDGTAVVLKLKNICVPKEKIDEIVPPAAVSIGDIQPPIVLSLSSGDISTETVEYKTPDIYSDEKVDKIIRKMNVRQLADVCVGEGIKGMMSTEKLFTPGAVGRTTSKQYRRGLINTNMSDGPAGLRLLRVSGLSRTGKLKLAKGCNLFSFMETLPDFLLRPFRAFPQRDTMLYQYATAFPVGTSLAQSWNTDLCEAVGRAISEEMDEFGVTYWLAPAMNIHRNPLCGRNFEYFSEDPVVAGKIAAALTRGVQSTAGNYVTIKHFACNNQEDNRMKSDSRVNERALREIYLKGFEICVREASPKSVMTSYNLINGIYSMNIYDLCTSVLRNEWGFDGIVMTDWFSTNKGLGRNDLAIKAGNDLIMPGGAYYKKEIIRGVRRKTVTKTELRRAAANVIRSVVHSRVADKISPKQFR